MALWDSAYLLQQAKFYARRPATDAAVSDAQWYALLAEAQEEAIADLTAVVPDSQYGAPTLLTTSDGGVTFQFPNTTSSLPPIGSVEVYRSLKDIPGNPLVPGFDFVVEEAQIRMPGQKVRSWPDGAPYARYALLPSGLSASVQPILNPPMARPMILYRALEKFATRPASGLDPQSFAQQYGVVRDRVLTMLRTQFNMAAAQAQQGQNRLAFAYSTLGYGV